MNMTIDIRKKGSYYEHDYEYDRNGYYPNYMTKHNNYRDNEDRHYYSEDEDNHSIQSDYAESLSEIRRDHMHQKGDYIHTTRMLSSNKDGNPNKSQNKNQNSEDNNQNRHTKSTESNEKQVNGTTYHTYQDNHIVHEGTSRATNINPPDPQAKDMTFLCNLIKSIQDDLKLQKINISSIQTQMEKNIEDQITTPLQYLTPVPQMPLPFPSQQTICTNLQNPMYNPQLQHPVSF